MVEPEGFYVGKETALDNHYMDLSTAADPDRARRQFHGLVRLIKKCGTEVLVFPGSVRTPDDVFPNNVFALVPGRLVIGNMRYPIRQLEAERSDIPAYFRERGYRIVDLRKEKCVAELTGVLIMDRARRIGFCGISERVNRAGAAAMHKAFDLRLTYCFDLAPDEYHTNVIFSVLAARACVLYPDACAEKGTAEAIEAAFPGRTLLLDKFEKDHFVGNCISLNNSDLFMSQSAADALRPANRARLESWGFRIHSTELDELEKAGGSLRCMVAKIF
ncbi:MAG: amidinotransferase [Xanthomonadales bacterium]|nr:amidinotransferase [Gammaproteobacteria bacterium]NND56532.1 amidinotransferase [Xanthomonadales bacterium]